MVHKFPINKCPNCEGAGGDEALNMGWIDCDRCEGDGFLNTCHCGCTEMEEPVDCAYDEADRANDY